MSGNPIFCANLQNFATKEDFRTYSRFMKMIDYNSETFTRAVNSITTLDELKTILGSGRQLRIKYGVDVTAPALHIGHAVNLWKMRELQNAGHKVVFLIGDFTTRVGDPTGRVESRKKIETADISKWAKEFLKQVGMILRTDKKVFEVRKNSEWYLRMKLDEFLNILSLFTHARLIGRDMFKERIKKGKEITAPELIYPILQGYDSVMIKSDITIVGSDQLFNENIGRMLQEKFGQSPQTVVTTAITPGLDGGQKMSKSLGNYIGISDTPKDKFGKAMRLLDKLIVSYLEVYTDVFLAKIREIESELKHDKNPMAAKLFFAESLVARYHGANIAKKEREEFSRVFSKKEMPENITAVSIKPGAWKAIDLIIAAKLARSKSEARRLIIQKAIEIDGMAILIPHQEVEVKKGSIIRAGKRKFIKLA